MTRAVHITGLGLATPLGGTLDKTWQALLGSKYIIDHARVSDLCDGPGLRINRLSASVAREALAGSNWSASQIAGAALVIGTSKGPVDGWLAEIPSECECFYGMSEVAARLAAEFRIGGPRVTMSAACASGLHALIRATMLIQQGDADRALVIGAESSLHPMFLQSFRRLGVLAPPHIGCRPFDEHRSGFLMSEAAAAICLEASDLTEPPRGRITIDRFALAGDATNLVGIDPDGRTLRRLLNQTIDHRPINLMHAHGTGTASNDPIELAAIEAALPVDPTGQKPHLYSHKGALGHSLGAAGMVALVINCLAHRDQIVPPNVRTSAPLEAAGLRISQKAERRSIGRSVVAASGFGGAAAAVSIISTVISTAPVESSEAMPPTA
ncbi:MAG TPA: beta-ketoacyl synthase N-terminal-like domain-containing protein, partial [Humisphaera sp.]|nr:beta-ketoacyl synthase N-terminal-like domain-containing protein [Humisphaera sp.]